MYLLVEPIAPLPDPPSRSTLEYSIKEPAKPSPYKLSPGEEDFALVFSTGDTPPLSEAETEEDIKKAYFARLEQEIKKFGRDLNPKAWMVHVPAMTEILVKGATPGTFKHFLMLLLEPDETFAKAQHSVQTWLNERYPGRVVDDIPKRGPYALWATDKQLLLGEIELLRDFRATMMSMRMARMDVCKESLSMMPPPKIPKSNDPTTFPAAQRQLHKYRNDDSQQIGIEHIGEAKPPPLSASVLVGFASSTALRPPNVQELWDDVIETMMNIARWLAKARCTESVDLFCDVARMFSPRDPPANLSDGNYSLIRALCDVMFDIDDIGSESSSSADLDFDGEDSLDTINREYFVDVAASRRSLMANLQLRMAADKPIAPAHMHGHRLSSHGSIRRDTNGKRMLNKRARSEMVLPKYIAQSYEDAFPADPSNWAANNTSPFAEAFQEELDREKVRRAYQRLKAICEEGIKARSRAVPPKENVVAQVAQVPPAKENVTPLKQKRRSLSVNCTGKQAAAMIMEALMKSRNEDPVSDVQEKEKPIVIEREPMADEQVDNEKLNEWSSF
ncbi:predicted protein [Histoplasma mississippiense (nom. inval.)]|uniref:predicted protein n=1 Tax=Ajellomyces capsulatus (strain NAm1 / WU24) TaxID=2059318 RepID=UPI000157C68D|nr:predicted protein [Histoplasma mississippiense (nom. inval.)]EDN08352.1 predicted protein [Histoplasma mississippiense (nom. inval.)]